MVDARAVANFILDRAENCGTPISALVLLKVLFFCHAWHLAKHGTPLIGQPFEAWKYGPVNRVVYEQVKVFGRRPITQKLMSFDAHMGGFVPTPYNFDENTYIMLQNIFDYYTRFDPFTLSDLTHEKGSPWDIIWQRAERNAVPGMIIPDDLIKEWFTGKGVMKVSLAQ